MITLHNVRKMFVMRGIRKIVANNLNVTFPTGKSVALLGRNGAGKSTLLKLISGEIRPDSGSINSTGRVSWPIGFAGSFHGDLTIQNVRFLLGCAIVDSDAYRLSDFSQLGKSLNVRSSALQASRV